MFIHEFVFVLKTFISGVKKKKSILSRQLLKVMILLMWLVNEYPHNAKLYLKLMKSIWIIYLIINNVIVKMQNTQIIILTINSVIKIMI